MNQPLTIKGKAWLYGYGFTSLLHLLAIAAGWSVLRFVTKPLLMALLLVFYLSATQKNSPARYTILLALIFSWLGDVFLMNQGNTYFTAGLASFLVAHIFYILFFARIRRTSAEPKPWNIILLIVLAAYVGIFYFFLGPALEAPLKIPVFLYAIIIATMFVMAWHSGKMPAATATPAATITPVASPTTPGNNLPSTLSSPHHSGYSSTLFIAGAALFILSDSLLAINAFLQPFQGASLWVMSTYCAAQAGIVLGAVITNISAFNSRKTKTFNQ